MVEAVRDQAEAEKLNDDCRIRRAEIKRRMSRTVRILLVSLVGLAVPMRNTVAQRGVPEARLSQELRIDGRREDFAVLNGGQLGPRGQLALTFRQDAQVRIYDAAGRRVATVGKKGSGPGEFRFPHAQGWLGDTVWIIDHTLRRLTFVTANGTLVRTTPLESIGKQMRLMPADSMLTVTNWTPHGMRTGGGMMGIATLLRRTPSGKAISEQAILSTTPDGSARRVITYAFDGRWAEEFAFVTVYGFAADGSDIVRAEVSDLRASGADLIITRLNRNADTVYSQRIPYSGIPLSRRHIDSVLARGVGVDGQHTVPANRIPPVYAPVSSVFVQPDGLTWLTLRETEAVSTVLMLNREGAPIARWKMPPRSDLMAASATHVWLREADPDGIQSVVRFRITCNGSVCR